MIKKYLLITVILFLFTTGFAFAQSTDNLQLNSWFEKKVNYAKSSVQLALLDLVKLQKDSLLETEGQQTSEGHNNLEPFTNNEKGETITSIQEKLNEYESLLDQTSTTLQGQTNAKFTGIVDKLKSQSDQLINPVDSEYEEALNIEPDNSLNLRNNLLEDQRKNSGDSLTKEIDSTKEVISELMTTYKNEKNPVVKDYIAKKIQLLDEVIQLLGS